MRRPRGLALFDAVVTMALLAAAAAALAQGQYGATRFSRAQADRRAAVRAAEAYLAAPTARPAGLTVTRLPTTAPAGYAWVRVEAFQSGHAGEVVGLLRSTP